jgi:putative transposase
VAIRAKEWMYRAAKDKSIRLLECETMIDHVHLLLECEKANLSNEMKLLKGRTALELFREFPSIKMDAGLDSFWQVSFKSRIVPQSQIGIVRRYLQTQDEHLEKYDW